MSWAYSKAPFSLSYRSLGEFIVFLLFGPALVMGGYFIQSGIFPDMRSFVLSLPFGLFTAGILFANEIPDCPQDIKSAKLNWAALMGAKIACRFYYFLMSLGFLSVLLAVRLNYISPFALLSLVCFFPMLKAAKIMKSYPEDKIKLISLSKLTINIQTAVSIIFIIAVFLRK